MRWTLSPVVCRLDRRRKASSAAGEGTRHTRANGDESGQHDVAQQPLNTAGQSLRTNGSPGLSLLSVYMLVTKQDFDAHCGCFSDIVTNTAELSSVSSFVITHRSISQNYGLDTEIKSLVWACTDVLATHHLMRDGWLTAAALHHTFDSIRHIGADLWGATNSHTQKLVQLV